MEQLKLTMTLLVRDEEDIIEDNIWFHHSQGVDSFIVMDNLSTDKTPEIIRSIAKEVDIEYLSQPADDYSQSDWVTEMARKAFLDHQAHWVINNDADEFWLPKSGTLKDVLSATAPDLSTLRVCRHNAVLCYDKNGSLLTTAHPRHSELFERESFNNLGRLLPRKCIHRASANVEVSQGNHDIKGLTGSTMDIDDEIIILHYPYRSLERYKRRIRLGGAAYDRNRKLPVSSGATWREHYKLVETEEIDRFWKKISKPKQAVLIDRIQGKIFRNSTVVEYIRRRLDRKREILIESEISRLHDETTILVDEFVKHQASFIARIAEEDRKYRPQFYNLQFGINGALRHLDEVTALHKHGLEWDLCKRFSNLRDIFSLFPRNSHLKEFMGEVLSAFYPEEVSRLRSDCLGKTIILHVSCIPRYQLAQQSIDSFSSLTGGYHHVVVVGTPGFEAESETELSIRYDGQNLIVPVPDSYENLHRKIFYALTVLHLVSDAKFVLKIDDNIRLKDAAVFQDLMSSIATSDVDYAGRLIGSETHESQWHGWHISKCSDVDMEARGYQYPLPRKYAAGGYGYVLGRQGLAACAYMYLAMKEFFSMRSVGLEDAYVGHAMYAQGIELHNVASPKDLLAFPGLASTEVEEV